MGRERKKSSLLDAVRAHLDALQAAGLPLAAVEGYEGALRRLRQSEGSASATPVLVRDVAREVDEFQAAIRKEFPGKPDLQAAFRALEPIPTSAREVLALGRHVARQAPAYAADLIKYGLNAATVRHLGALCDQLENELGGPDPTGEVSLLEEQILAAARQAFAGRPELAAFGLR